MIFGNVFGNRKPNDPNPERGVVVASVIRAQAHNRDNQKPLQVKEMISKMAEDKKMLNKLQEVNSFYPAKIHGAETNKS